MAHPPKSLVMLGMFAGVMLGMLVMLSVLLVMFAALSNTRSRDRFCKTGSGGGVWEFCNTGSRDLKDGVSNTGSRDLKDGVCNTRRTRRLAR